MKNLPWIISLVLALLLVVGWGKTQAKRQAWEYKSVVANVSTVPPITTTWREDGKSITAPANLADKFKELGEQGWELTQVEFSESIFAYWFKRPKA